MQSVAKTNNLLRKMANIREFDSHVVGFFGFFGFCIDKVIPEGLSAKVLAYVDMVYTVSLKTIEETGHAEDQKKRSGSMKKLFTVISLRNRK